MTKKKKPTVAPRKVQVGMERYENLETGEVIELPQFVIKGGDFNFEKAWIWHLASAYKLIGNKSVEILNFLFENKNSENQIVMTQRIISEKTKIGIATVNRVMRKLKKCNVITAPQSGVYRINPEIVFRGSHENRMRVLVEYRNEKAKDPLPLNEQKAQSLEQTIERKEKELRDLKELRKNILQDDEELTERPAAE